MIQIDETIIRDLLINRVSSEEANSIINDSVSDYEGEAEELILKKVFLKPFLQIANTFEFKHEIDLNYNVLFNLSKAIYQSENFVENSKAISNYLISISKHPNIKDGDLFIVKFDDIKFDNKYYEGLGIYKFEDKESFIETSAKNDKMDFKFRKGIGGKKPDKACLIIFTEEPYTVLVIDNNSADTDYWQNDFINHKSKNDFINNTNDFLTLAKTFITKQIPNEYEVTKPDQIEYLNRSVNYFKTHESFDKGEFEREVFNDNGLIESFNNYNDNYVKANGLEISDNFEISNQAVKKQARIFKSVLKLDKNFHIYIHGNRQLIEQGIDENGRKFYKIYYEDEF